MTTAAATKVEKTIFEKKYVSEAQCRAAADKAGVADIRKEGFMWVAVKPEAAKATPAKPVTNKAPTKAAAKPAPAKAVTNKAPAKPAPTLKLVQATTPAVKAAPKAKAGKAVPVTAEVKRGPGKPISPEALKARGRVVAHFEKQVAANATDLEVTVKVVTKALKIKKVTVSNTIRWAEAEGLIKRMGYKLKTGPGRKEVFYTIQTKALAKYVKDNAKAKAA